MKQYETMRNGRLSVLHYKVGIIFVLCTNLGGEGEFKYVYMRMRTVRRWGEGGVEEEEGGIMFQECTKSFTKQHGVLNVGQYSWRKVEDSLKSSLFSAVCLWLDVTASVMKVSLVEVKWVLSSSGRQGLVWVRVPCNGPVGGRKDLLSEADTSAKKHTLQACQGIWKAGQVVTLRLSVHFGVLKSLGYIIIWKKSEWNSSAKLIFRLRSRRWSGLTIRDKL